MTTPKPFTKEELESARYELRRDAEIRRASGLRPSSDPYYRWLATIESLEARVERLAMALREIDQLPRHDNTCAEIAQAALLPECCPDCGAVVDRGDPEHFPSCAQLDGDYEERFDCDSCGAALSMDTGELCPICCNPVIVGE
jgi:hypothetical protein